MIIRSKADFDELAAMLPPVPAHWPPSSYVYALIDPETEEVRYIGKSVRPWERLMNHMNERSNCHRSHWLQSIKSRGLRPLMMILETVSGEWPWQEAERYWIARARAEGWPLVNGTDGGDGVVGLSEESRAKMAATWKGRKHSPETIEKLKAARRNRKTSDATRAKMSASQRGRVITWGDALAAAVRKLTDAQVKEIAGRIEAGERVTALAAEYGLHRTTVSKIKKGTYYDRYRS